MSMVSDCVQTRGGVFCALAVGGSCMIAGPVLLNQGIKIINALACSCLNQREPVPSFCTPEAATMRAIRCDSKQGSVLVGVGTGVFLVGTLFIVVFFCAYRYLTSRGSAERPLES
jgi:hypothetical protein